MPRPKDGSAGKTRRPDADRSPAGASRSWKSGVGTRRSAKGRAQIVGSSRQGRRVKLGRGPAGRGDRFFWSVVGARDRWRERARTGSGSWAGRLLAALSRACSRPLLSIAKNDVLAVMLLASVLLHVVVLGLFWGFRLLGGTSPRAPRLVSHEFFIDLGPPPQPVGPSIRLPTLKPPPGMAAVRTDPAPGKPINVLTVPVPSAMPGLLSGGDDIKSRMLGLGGSRDGMGGLGKGPFGSGTGPRSFSLGGGTVKASAIIVLLDASGSMQSDQKMERAREKMRDMTRRAGVRVMAEIEVPNCAFHQIAGPGADIGSPADAAYAMSAAMRRYPFADAIYFFSDFQDTVAPEAVEQLRLIATECDPKVAVYLHTLEQEPDRALVALCRATGGQVLR